MMLIALPLLPYALLFWAFRLHGYGWRVAAIHAAAWWGVFVTAVTEVLSVFVALNKADLAIAWLLIDAGVTFYIYRRRASLRAHLIRAAAPRQKLDLSNRFLIAGIAINLLLVAIAAILCPPNTADAMSYHMPRIVHWIHNGTVAFFPTHDRRQVALQPWAEYAMLQFHALSGGDRFDALVQWFSLAGSAITASLIAELLGALYSGQVLAALLCVTIPQGVLEASGAKNDVVVSFWLTALLYFLLAFRKDMKLPNAFGIGAALGLACLTKGTAYVYAPPLLIAALFLWPWRERLKLAKYLLVAGALFITINVGHYIRDFRVFGSPLGPIAFAPPNGFKLSNDSHKPAAFASNVLRNIALQASVPSDRMRASIQRDVNRVVSSFTDSSDPRTTWDGTTFGIPEFRLHETIASNPMHVIIIVITIAILLVWWRVPPLRSTLIVAAGLLMGFALFCFELKWQPWHTRLHLPMFVLWAGVSGLVLAKAWPRYATTGLGVVFLLISWLYAMGNYLRPLYWPDTHSIFKATRREMYFNDRPGFMPIFADLAKFVKEQGCDNIGLNGPGDDYEYALLVFLDDVAGNRNIRHIDVNNSTNKSRVKQPAGASCVVVCMDCSPHIDLINLYARKFASLRFFDNTAVFSNSRNQRTTVSYPRTDFDRNKVSDLVFQNSVTHQMTVYYLGGPGGVTVQSSAHLQSRPHPGWNVVAAGDFNRDGSPDLVWQDPLSGYLLIEYLTGGGGIEHQSEFDVQPRDATGFRVVASADFDRDGIPDLVWQDLRTQQASVWYMGGPNGASRRQWSWLNRDNASGWHIVAAADFNGDGVPDLVWQHEATRQVIVHYYSGALGDLDAGYNWLARSKAPGWHVVTAADFNADSVPDLLWQNDSTGQLRVDYYGGAEGSVVTGSALLNAGDLRGWTLVSH